MSLSQAVGVIMGANIGTTVTGQLIALDISAAAPLIAFVGVVLAVFIKKEQLRHIGGIVAGLGVLFIGMDMMSTAMEPLQDSAAFTQAVTTFDNPVIGILVGAGFTALIQSSSASVGILQALATGGLIGLPQAVYVLFGQNIGTCITAVLAAIGTKAEAKRTTIIHLMFNIFGTILFTLICMATPFVALMEGLTPGNGAAQIANVHTIFNVVTHWCCCRSAARWQRSRSGYCRTARKKPSSPTGCCTWNPSTAERTIKWASCPYLSAS